MKGNAVVEMRGPGKRGQEQPETSLTLLRIVNEEVSHKVYY